MPQRMTQALAGIWLVLVTGVGLLTGCSSVSPSQYVSPRVVGRVLDHETQQPLADVRVRRTSADSNARVSEPSGGGRLVETASAVRTDSGGRFTMRSTRTLSPIGSAGWYSITLAFERSGYESLLRSYTLKDATNTAAGEPVINTGDVLLPKVSRP